MISWYIHRLVPCPGIFRKDSSGNRWEQEQRVTSSHCVENLNQRFPLGDPIWIWRNHEAKKKESLYGSMEMKDTRRTYPNEKLSRTSKGYATFCTRSSACMLWLLSWCLSGTPNIGRYLSLTLLTPCGTPIFLLDSLVQTQYEGFCLLILCIVLQCLTVACYSFLKREWRESRFLEEGRMKGA